MSKDPAFLFYPGDWLGGTLGMTFQEKGAYLELLMLQFNTGPFTEAYAKRMLSVEEAALWEILKIKFETDGQKYWNGRLEKEINKRKSFVESRRLAGLAPKKKKEAYAKRGENENRNENIIINEDEKKIPTPEEFLNFCKTIPGINYKTLEFSLKAKYEAFISDGWRDGNGNKIKNWKSKIKNIIPHLKPLQAAKEEPRPRMIDLPSRPE